MTTTLAPSQLATPPQPPIPALDRPLGPDELEAALRSFHGSYYVQHPFHQLMYEGKNPDGNMAALVGAPREGLTDFG